MTGAKPGVAYTWIVVILCVAVLVGVGLLTFVVGSDDERLSPEETLWANRTAQCLAEHGVDIEPLSNKQLSELVKQRDVAGIESFPFDCAHAYPMGTGESDSYKADLGP